MTSLFIRSGDTYQPASDEQIISQARVLAEAGFTGTQINLGRPQATREFLITQFAALEHEVFAVIYLNNRHNVIGFEILFRGTIDGASVHPREVLKAALRKNAAAVIFAHNHPSGVAEPSTADEAITAHLVKALALIDIRVLDHVIVAGVRTCSLAERGVL